MSFRHAGRIGLVFFFSLLFSLSQAQNRISGTVSNAVTGNSLAGVSVVISDLHTGTQTNDSGYFMFPSGVRGTHLVEFSHIQFNSLLVQVDFSQNDHLKISLQPAIVENAPVIVTGVAKATDSRKVPFSVNLIKAGDMQGQPGLNIVDHIAKIPGVSSLQSGPAVQKPVIRGLGYNRVLVLHDGVRQEGQQWGDEHGLEIGGEVEKIEVLKGAASLIYGSDAMAGVVNIISDADISKNTQRGSVSTTFQSNNRLRSMKTGFGLNRNGFVLQADGALKSAADFRNARDGDVFNSKFRQQNAAVMIGLHKRWGFSHLRFSHYNLLTGMVEGERDSSGRFLKITNLGEVPVSAGDILRTKPYAPFQKITHRKLSVDNNLSFNKKRLYVNVGLQENRRREYGDLLFSEPSLDFRLRSLTWVARLHLIELRKWELAIGTNGMHQKNENFGSESLIPEFDLTEGGLFTYIKINLGKATLSGGLRYDARQINVAGFEGGSGFLNNPYERHFRNLSSSAGISIAPWKKIVLKANISNAFRAPAISELSSDGAHEGTLRYEYGNRNLAYERSWQGDIGFEYNSKHLVLSAAAFYNHFNNYIFYRKLRSVTGADSTIFQNEGELTAFTFGQQRAYLTGFEISFDLRPHPLDWLHIESSFSFVSGRFFEEVDGSKNLPMIPAPSWKSEIRAEGKKITGFSNPYIKLEAEHNFKQTNAFTGFGTETNTNGYTLFNFGLGSGITAKGNTVLSFHFQIGNLFNTVYQNHLSRLKYAPVNPYNGYRGIWGMGRNITFSLQVPLFKNTR